MSEARPGRLPPVLITRATVLASLVPLAAALAATQLALRDLDRSGWAFLHPVSLGLYLGFVAVPSVVPLAVARGRTARAAALVAMVAIAVAASTAAVVGDDAQSGFAILWVGLGAVVVASVIWLVQRVAAAVAARRHAEPPMVVLAGLPDQLAALAIDLGVVAAVVAGPMVALGHEPRSLFTVALVAVAAGAYLGVAMAWSRGTLGQAALGLWVVDARTFRPVPPARALALGALRAIELVLATTWALPVLAVDGLTTLCSGRGVPDRIARTSVLARR